MGRLHDTVEARRRQFRRRQDLCRRRLRQNGSCCLDEQISGNVQQKAMKRGGLRILRGFCEEVLLGNAGQKMAAFPGLGCEERIGCQYLIQQPVTCTGILMAFARACKGGGRS